ncbi:MAG: hypothetical protein ACI9TY_001786 [Alphaproteobacteria bacterium]|jgi:hypothetical protein
MMTVMKNWVENELNPWKQAMSDYENQTKDVVSIVQRNAAELKYIISLLLEKREAEAVKIWNDLELNPLLESIKLNIEKDELTMKTLQGEDQFLSITSLLAELEMMLNG